jgi:hypothetical protein
MQDFWRGSIISATSFLGSEIMYGKDPQELQSRKCEIRELRQTFRLHKGN